MLALYAKALTHRPSQAMDGIPVLPQISRYQKIKINPKHCTNYNELCQWQGNFAAVVHPAYIQTLSLAMQLSMMVDASFPFKPIGLVHIANQIDVKYLPDQDATLGLVTSFGDIFWHKKGWLFEVITQALEVNSATSNSDLAELAKNTQRMVVTGRSYYLARCKHDTPNNQTDSDAIQAPNWLNVNLHKFDEIIGGHRANVTAVNDVDSASNHVECWQLKFNSDVGRQYAAVSGDYNPIHLYNMTAKLLGFKKAIAHGMYSKALIMSKIAKDIKFTSEAFCVRGVFLQAIALPATTKLIAQAHGNGQIDFSLYSQSKHKHQIHLMGTVEQ